MTAIIKKIVSVEPYGDNLSIIKTNDGDEVIANRKEDGQLRWAVDDIVAYISVGSIVPEDVLKERGYWDEEKNRGLLDGGKRNRVKARKIAGFETKGLLFGADSFFSGENDVAVSFRRGSGYWSNVYDVGEDASDFFGITEFKG